MTTFQFVGTVNVSLPSLKPLKFKPPFSCVRPAVSWNVAVFVALSTASHVQSICGACAGGFCAAASVGSEMNPMRSEASRFMRPNYLATRADRKTQIHVPARRRLVEPIPRRIDDDRADVAMIECVVDAKERRQPDPTRSPVPTDAHIRRPPRRGTNAREVAHQVA